MINSFIFVMTSLDSLRITLTLYTATLDLHFFIWLLGMIENLSESGRHSDVEIVVAMLCAYHLQHQRDSQNPVTEALRMAQAHILLETALVFLSKHGKIYFYFHCPLAKFKFMYA